jgi:hypothetical protein
MISRTDTGAPFRVTRHWDGSTCHWSIIKTLRRMEESLESHTCWGAIPRLVPAPSQGQDQDQGLHEDSMGTIMSDRYNWIIDTATEHSSSAEKSDHHQSSTRPCQLHRFSYLLNPHCYFAVVSDNLLFESARPRACLHAKGVGVTLFLLSLGMWRLGNKFEDLAQRTISRVNHTHANKHHEQTL